MGEPDADAQFLRQMAEVKQILPSAEHAITQARSDEGIFRAIVVHQNQELLAALKDLRHGQNQQTKALVALIKVMQKATEPEQIPELPHAGDPTLWPAGVEG